jgi:Outer membrane protein beta-barrel domain
MIFSKWLDQSLTAARKYLLGVAVLLVACVTPLFAQQQSEPAPRVEGKVIFGSATFGDDIDHKVVGGAMRVYVTKRLSIEPEYLYLRHSENDQDQHFQPNVAYDFIKDSTGRLVVYGIGGVGVLHHQGDRLSFNDFFTGEPRVVDTSFTTWTATAGVGAKIFVTKRLFVTPELRVGREPTVRATISVGYVFAQRH